jgi:hypothetical protein
MSENTNKIEELKNKITELQEIRDKVLSQQSDAELIADLDHAITKLKIRLVRRVTGRNV